MLKYSITYRTQVNDLPAKYRRHSLGHYAAYYITGLSLLMHYVVNIYILLLLEEVFICITGQFNGLWNNAWYLIGSLLWSDWLMCERTGLQKVPSSSSSRREEDECRCFSNMSHCCVGGVTRIIHITQHLTTAAAMTSISVIELSPADECETWTTYKALKDKFTQTI